MESHNVKETLDSPRFLLSQFSSFFPSYVYVFVFCNIILFHYND